MKIYTLWTADQWLMHRSFELHGIFSSKENAILFAQQNHLLLPSSHVLIDCGELDDYDNTSHRIFCTQNDSDFQQLKTNTPSFKI